MMRFQRLASALLSSLMLVAASGCDETDGPAGPGNDGGPDSPGGGDHTWYSDVGPLLVEKCGACHQDGSIAPFTIDYDAAYPWRASIKAEVEARTMPPMTVNNDGSCQTFSNARWLTDAEIKMIGDWVDAGAPEGEVAELPAFPEDLVLDDPDLEIETPEYEANDAIDDDYRCFPVVMAGGADKFLTEYEVVPGNKAIAHHMILYLIDSADAALTASTDAASPDVPGYPCFGAATPDGGTGQERPLILWAPGSGRSKMPEGTGIRIPAGSTVVMQMHYNLANGGGTDQTKIKMMLADDGDVEEAIFFPLANTTMSVASGEEYVEALPGAGFENGRLAIPDLPVDVPITIHGVFPHMHKMGRTLRVDFTSNEGGDQCLVDVDRWDFNWQEGWWYDEPIEFPKSGTGREFTITCGFDTRSSNMPEVSWGEGSDDEMCLNYLYITSPFLAQIGNF
jgi:hypothetical protein